MRHIALSATILALLAFSLPAQADTYHYRVMAKGVKGSAPGGSAPSAGGPVRILESKLDWGTDAGTRTMTVKNFGTENFEGYIVSPGLTQLYPGTTCNGEGPFWLPPGASCVAVLEPSSDLAPGTNFAERVQLVDPDYAEIASIPVTAQVGVRHFGIWYRSDDPSHTLNFRLKPSKYDPLPGYNLGSVTNRGNVPLVVSFACSADLACNIAEGYSSPGPDFRGTTSVTVQPGAAVSVGYREPASRPIGVPATHSIRITDDAGTVSETYSITLTWQEPYNF